MTPKKGDFVAYHFRPDNAALGRIKSIINGELVFVVFACGGDWDKYEDFTGSQCSILKLKKLNIDENNGCYTLPDGGKREGWEAAQNLIDASNKPLEIKMPDRDGPIPM